jgi:two-component system sensor kinase FixL
MLALIRWSRNQLECLVGCGRYVQIGAASRPTITQTHEIDAIAVTETKSSLELQALLDAAVDGIIVIDHLGLIQSFNRAAERLFGYRGQEVIGRNVSILMTDEDRDTHDGFLARYVSTRVPHIIGRGREVSAKRKDGTVFPALLAVGAVSQSDPPRFVGFVHDNSAQRQSEVEAHRLQERLMHVSRLATVGEMASGIAHELNQPLAAIATYAHACDRLLGMPDPQIDEIQTALKQIAEQAVRAGDIIRRLRGLARTEDVSRAPADVNIVIEELTELIHADANAHGVEYRRELAPDLPGLVLDRSQIQQVVMNLVHNALEALALGQLDTKEVVVRTRATASGDVEISVCDNGVGVHSSIENRMFDPFCSTKATGTGLGLPISRTIVRAHGGALEYRPNEPRGACFTVKLPAPRAEPA